MPLLSAPVREETRSHFYLLGFLLSFHSVDYSTSETRLEDKESESHSQLLDSMELPCMSYSVMLSPDVQCCLLQTGRWRWDRNNAVDI